MRFAGYLTAGLDGGPYPNSALSRREYSPFYGLLKVSHWCVLELAAVTDVSSATQEDRVNIVKGLLSLLPSVLATMCIAAAMWLVCSTFPVM